MSKEKRKHPEYRIPYVEEAKNIFDNLASKTAFGFGFSYVKGERKPSTVELTYSMENIELNRLEPFFSTPFRIFIEGDGEDINIVATIDKTDIVARVKEKYYSDEETLDLLSDNE